MLHPRAASQPRLFHRVLTNLLLAWPLVCLPGCSDRGSLIAPENARTAALFQVTEGQPQIAAEGGTRLGQYRRIWPHADGQGWIYRVTGRGWDQPPPVLYTTPGEVPAFSIDDAIHLLGSEPTGPNPQTSGGTYRLQFSGTVTTQSGVTRQNLTEALEPDPSAAASSATPAAHAGSAFLDLLRRARPDLAGKLDRNPPRMSPRAGVTSLARIVFHPTLLHGYAWEQTDQWIGTYGDLNQQIAWIFLTPDLRPGSEFSLQLVPDLADDVFLHARVLGWRSVETEAGTFRRALEVAYLVDFGVTEITDFDGNTLGYVRDVLFGTVDYVIGVGPVRSYERLQITVDPLNRGNSDETTSLSGTVGQP
jgi:hypothetical protein